MPSLGNGFQVEDNWGLAFLSYRCGDPSHFLAVSDLWLLQDEHKLKSSAKINPFELFCHSSRRLANTDGHVTINIKVGTL